MANWEMEWKVKEVIATFSNLPFIRVEMMELLVEFLATKNVEAPQVIVSFSNLFWFQYLHENIHLICPFWYHFLIYLHALELISYG